MQITATLAALCASIALVSAQNHGGATYVDFCNSANYEGCTTQASKSAACVNVTPGVEGQGSVRPQKGSFCYFFTNADCDTTSGDLFHVGNPGVADLTKTPVNGPDGATRDFSQKINSYKCSEE